MKKRLLLFLSLVLLIIFSHHTFAQSCGSWEPETDFYIYFWPNGDYEWYDEYYYSDEVYLSGDVEDGCYIYLSFPKGTGDSGYNQLSGYFYGSYDNGYEAPEFFSTAHIPPTTIENEEEFLCEGNFSTYHISSISDGYFECSLKLKRWAITPPESLPDCHECQSEQPMIVCPDWWNTTERVGEANCYGYARNILDRNDDIPKDNNFTNYGSSDVEFARNAIAYDNILSYKSYDTGYSGTPSSGYVLLLMFADVRYDDHYMDFHFYRKDSDGTWSHKDGSNDVEILSVSSNADVVNLGNNYGGGGFIFVGFYEYEIDTP